MKTAKVDNKKRVLLPGVIPGQVFSVVRMGEIVTLTPVKPVVPEPKFIRPVKLANGLYRLKVKVSKQEIVDSICEDRNR